MPQLPGSRDRAAWAPPGGTVDALRHVTTTGADLRRSQATDESVAHADARRLRDFVGRGWAF